MRRLLLPVAAALLAAASVAPLGPSAVLAAPPARAAAVPGPLGTPVPARPPLPVAAGDPSAMPGAVAVPAGVKIPVVLTTTLSSGTLKRGDRFEFKTAKAETLGALAVPAGTPGSGRIASVTKASKGHNGTLAFQADDLTLPTGTVVWIDMDRSAPAGHYARGHVIPYVLPIPPVILPGAFVSRSGDLIVDAGARFTVVTTAPRHALAPLFGGPPASPTPIASAAPAPARPSPSGGRGTAGPVASPPVAAPLGSPGVPLASPSAPLASSSP